jgi:hypothetical protein
MRTRVVEIIVELMFSLKASQTPFNIWSKNMKFEQINYFFFLQ